MLSQMPLAQPLARLEPVREHFCSLSEFARADPVPIVGGGC
jgi:hypothetical protein